MTDDARRWKTIQACAFWIVLLCCVYFGTYRSLVSQRLAIRMGKTRPVPRYGQHGTIEKTLQAVFWPAHQVDSFVRPGLWRELSDEPLQMSTQAL